MEQVNFSETPCVQLEVHAGGQCRRPVDGCVVAIAKFCDCKVWLMLDGVVSLLVEHLKAGDKAATGRPRHSS